MSDYTTPITAPPTYETLKELWLGKAPTSGASERYDREVNFEAWALEHGIRPTPQGTNDLHDDMIRKLIAYETARDAYYDAAMEQYRSKGANRE